MRIGATRKIIYLLFGTEPVSRGQYAVVGFALMTVKYAMDFAVLFFGRGLRLSPLTYLHPLLSRQASLGEFTAPLILWLLVVTALPFAWMGSP